MEIQLQEQPALVFGFHCMLHEGESPCCNHELEEYENDRDLQTTVNRMLMVVKHAGCNDFFKSGILIIT